jgi:hypothetical protein
MVVGHFEIGVAHCPPESGGQGDRGEVEVEIVRRVVPKLLPCKVDDLEPPRRFAPPLLTQEGNFSL